MAATAADPSTFRPPGVAMSAPLSAPAADLLGRLARSLGPWRVVGLPAANLSAVQELVARGLVERHRGVYEVTPAGRAALADPTP